MCQINKKYLCWQSGLTPAPAPNRGDFLSAKRRGLASQKSAGGAGAGFLPGVFRMGFRQGVSNLKRILPADPPEQLSFHGHQCREFGFWLRTAKNSKSITERFGTFYWEIGDRTRKKSLIYTGHFFKNQKNDTCKILYKMANLLGARSPIS